MEDFATEGDGHTVFEQPAEDFLKSKSWSDPDS